ncbi:hypothetical protein PRIPAC_80160 [Pristionchus pacificus]|uniref:G protein-coupled receptor n=1 Tax=Pristionchus pacificus TaxID=54126 RepID=A0A2A6C3M5_PRIPA|nr:hypothetical protein PRIPAC_80160 [Pristionchus pacificus]|eukprot:PDM72842.1 G protein-coupled receptor [Pristionchus pacificus]
MSFLTLLAIAVPSCLVYYVISYYWWVSKYPKGPLPYPIVGNLRQLNSKDLHLQFRELSLKYGPIFTIFMPVPVVIVTSYEGVKEAYVTKGESVAARPPVPINEDFTFGENAGIINANGESWMENRRLTISILRDFGMGKSLMEAQVHLSITQYLSHLESISNKESVDLKDPIQLMIANIINQTLFGFRYSPENCKPLFDFVNAFTFLTEMGLSNLLIRFSAYTLRFIMYIPFMRALSRKATGNKLNAMKAFLETSTERGLKTMMDDGENGCFVHAYSRKIGSSLYITKPNLYAVCLEVFAAGQETTTTTMRWATLLLAANQRDKAREEILRVVGSDRLPSLTDKNQMPYTSALVHEVQRRANIIQVNVNRRTTEDIDILGYHIPADTTVVGDVFQIMAHDPIFENPEQFRPERYLSEDGKTMRKDLVERTMPFSAGKRHCAGEGLARVELFLGIAATLQHYHLLPNDESPIDLEPKSTINMMPKQQNLKLVPSIMSLLALFPIVLPSCLILYVINYYWWVSKYPKCPRPYPIVENLRQLNTKDIHLQFRELSLKYGPIFTVFLPFPVVVITNYEGVKDETKDTTHSDYWKYVIDTSAKALLRDHRFRTMNILVSASMLEFLMRTEKAGWKIDDWPFPFFATLLMVANIIIETLFGFRYSYSESQPIVDFMNAFSSLAMALSNQLIRFSPYTLRFVNRIPMMQRVSRKVHGPKFNLMKSFIESNTEKALKSLNENLEDSCFVHSYARKIGSSPNITRQQLYAVCLEVFAGGQKTTTTTLRWIFLCGNTLCCLALWTIHMSKTLRDSFGVLCKYQMFADISMLLLTTSYSMIPTEMAPPPEASFSYWITSVAEVFYFFSGEMHVLFALHRFICIVFPTMKQGWRRSTHFVLCFCLLVAIFRTFIMTSLDANLYWVYDRKQSIWYTSNTEWTEFYEVFWSVLEIVFILMLDCVTFSRLLSKKSKVGKAGKQKKESVSVHPYYHHNLNLLLRISSSERSLPNVLMHFLHLEYRQPFGRALANRKKKNTVVVTAVTTSSSAISAAK